MATNSTSIAHTKSPPSNPCSSAPNSLKQPNPPPRFLNFNWKTKRVPMSLKILRVSNCLNLRPQELRNSSSSPISSYGVVSLKLHRLVSKFQSLPEPIDRVKKLLDYATVLPQISESTRSPENRVAGCAAQVWLEVEMDELRRMRFGADSDSEITKGFASCLIYLLDGASPEEVLMVKAEDLADMNVGLSVRSRINSWHTLLVSMQERTKSLMAKRGGIPPLDPLSSTAITPSCYCQRLFFQNLRLVMTTNMSFFDLSCSEGG